jgi:glycosyltransferase involved in cell wall biosynthesis
VIYLNQVVLPGHRSMPIIKVMIIIHSLKGGGAERAVVNLLKGLNRRDFSVTLLLYEEIFDYPRPENIELITLGIRSSKNILKFTLGFVKKIISIAKSIRINKPDIVFSVLSGTNVIAILAQSLSGIGCKVVGSEQNHPSLSLQNQLYDGVTKFLMRRFYPKAEKIIAISQGIKKDLVENFHLTEEKIEVVYNPVDIREIEILSEEAVYHPWFNDELPIIVSVGRLTKQKGHSYLIKAFSVVRQSLPCRLLIIGTGDEEGNLINAVDRLGLRNDVEFLGFQKNPFKYMAKSSLFVSSSIYEGFGNVIVEGMALGLPVISTDCPSGPSEIIEHEKNGLLVPIKDERALAQAILKVLTNDDMKRSLSDEARSRARHFDLNSIVQKYGNIFLETSPYH